MTKHIVKPNESLLSIANQYHFYKVDALIEANQELFGDRLSNNALLPGDEIVIPDKVTKAVTVQTGRKHVFVLKRDYAELRVEIRDEQAIPLENVDYTLEIPDHEISIAGKTQAKGLIREKVPISAKQAFITVIPDPDFPEKEIKRTVMLNGLNPVEDVTGIQQRLYNLGFDCGKIDGVMGPRTQTAVKEFQFFHQLKTDGVVGDLTNTKLTEPIPPGTPSGTIDSSTGTFESDALPAATASTSSATPQSEPSNEETEPESKQATIQTICFTFKEEFTEPIPFEQYELTLADRTEKTGYTDENGEIRLKNIAAGTCQIRFTNYNRLISSESQYSHSHIEIEIIDNKTIDIAPCAEFSFSR